MEIYKLSDFEKGGKKLIRRNTGTNDHDLGDGSAGFRDDGRSFGDDGFGDNNRCVDDVWSLDDSVSESGFGEVRHVGDSISQRGFGDGQKKVTEIRQSNKNPNRVNIYINDKYGFSLDIAQVVELKIKVGRILSATELEECRYASEFGKAYQRALEWALMRPRSVRELKDYLVRRAWRSEAEEKKREWRHEREIADLVAAGEDVDAERMKQRMMNNRERANKNKKYDFTDLIVERLVERGYVDDEKFAEYYVENRFVKKGISKKRLKMELVKKGIAEDIIDNVIGARNDEEEIKKIIAKKYHKYDEGKLIQYLCRQGFDYQLVQSLVRSYETD